MRILYVFPHPDDESFGPAAAISKQIRNGDEVHLLTLTKGGATKVRHKLGITVEEMGEVRYREMLCVKEVLGLKSLTVWDMPDSGLAEMDPRIIERSVREHIDQVRPDVVVSYPVYGISGFPDHLVMHAVIKRVYLEMKDEGADYLRRLAFFAISRVEGEKPFNLKPSAEGLIDCVVKVTEEDVEIFNHALDCYGTYQELIDRTGVRDSFRDRVYFEIFGEDHDPLLEGLGEKI